MPQTNKSWALRATLIVQAASGVGWVIIHSSSGSLTVGCVGPAIGSIRIPVPIIENVGNDDGFLRIHKLADKGITAVSLSYLPMADWLQAIFVGTDMASELGVIVRSEEHLSRARAAVAAAGLDSHQLTERGEVGSDRVAVGTMHFAKGLEFKAVAVMACDDEALPLQSRIDNATDENELREVFETERHLFYVACTRARDHLHISGVKPVPEFLADLES